MKAAVPQAGSLLLPCGIRLQFWRFVDFHRFRLNDGTTPVTRKIPRNMALEKSRHTLADPRQEKGQGNEIADDPRNDQQEPGDGPKQAFGGPA